MAFLLLNFPAIKGPPRRRGDATAGARGSPGEPPAAAIRSVRDDQVKDRISPQNADCVHAV